jgi:hypothetical protein
MAVLPFYASLGKLYTYLCFAGCTNTLCARGFSFCEHSVQELKLRIVFCFVIKFSDAEIVFKTGYPKTRLWTLEAAQKSDKWIDLKMLM